MMFSPQVGRAAFRVAILIILLAGGLLVSLKPGTVEFAVTVLTLVIGLVFVGLIVALIKLVTR